MRVRFRYVAGVLKRLACEQIEKVRVAHAFASQIRPNGQGECSVFVVTLDSDVAET